ncbi:MAG: hypothetical protein HOO96_30140 [Polyangiaceae bacterium]|nr:hypothetical protein [Polyangiaceae bacterium]
MSIDAFHAGQFLSPDPTVSACTLSAEATSDELLTALSTSVDERFDVRVARTKDGEGHAERRHALYRETFRIESKSYGAKATAEIRMLREPAGWLGVLVLFVLAPGASFAAFAVCFAFKLTAILASLGLVVGALIPIGVWKKWTDHAALRWQVACSRQLSAIEEELPSKLSKAKAYRD